MATNRDGIRWRKGKRKALVAEAVELLTAFPVLAKEPLPSSVPQMCRGYEGKQVTELPPRFPLFVIVFRKAALDQVRTVYDLFPGALVKEGNHLVHLLEEDYLGLDVKTFLVEKYPEHLACPFECPYYKWKKYPIHALMRARDQMQQWDPENEEDYKQMVECEQEHLALRPQRESLVRSIIEKFPEACDQQLVHAALRGKYSEEILSLILQFMTLSQSCKTLEIGRGYERPQDMCHGELLLDMEATRAISKAIPYLETFSCSTCNPYDYPGYSNAGTVTQLVSSLRKDSVGRLQNVKLTVPSAFFRSDGALRASLQALVSSTDTLKTMWLSLERGPQPLRQDLGWDDLFWAELFSGLEGRQAPLKALRLGWFQFQGGPTSLAVLVSTAHCPASLYIYNVAWGDSDTWPLITSCEGSNLQSFSVSCKDTMTSDFVMPMLEQMRMIPRLRELEIEQYRDPSQPRIDITDGVRSLLSNRPSRLESLQLYNAVKVDLSVVCHVLYSNDTLTELQIFDYEDRPEHDYLCLERLMRANTTLTVIGPLTEDQNWTTIEHYAQLNLFGRKKAREATTSKGELVGLLQRVTRKYRHSGSAGCRRTSTGVPFLYELLHENPACWSGQLDSS